MIVISKPRDICTFLLFKFEAELGRVVRHFLHCGARLRPGRLHLEAISGCRFHAR